MRRFDYTSATTIDETIQLLSQDGNGSIRPLAGGTDLLTLIKADITVPIQVVDIKRLSAIPRGIHETAQGVTLGALTTLAEIEMNGLIQQRYPLLAEAAGLAATPQLRNMATIGGNLLQRPRCWYFRNANFHCWLKGGDECHAREGENQLHALIDESPCVAVHPSDLASTLVALDAHLDLRGPNGERTLAIDEFFTLPEQNHRQETALDSNELILAIHLPALPQGARSTYLKAMDRKVWAFALVGVAAILQMQGETIADARLVLSGVAPIPWRVPAAEQLLVGQRASEALFARAAEEALMDAQPLEHNGYKVALARSLIQRALSNLAQAQ
jgi:xanthine dehydrogenase YagS FAD-binding subunit